MKNLRINKNKMKALLGSIILTTNLAACSYESKDSSLANGSDTVLESSFTNANIDYVICGEKLVSVNDILLARVNEDTQTISEDMIVEKVDGVIVDDKIMQVENPIEIKFNSDISNVVLGNDILSPDKFILIDRNSRVELTEITGYVSNGNIYAFDGSLTSNLTNDADDEETYEYEELTEEKFNKLCDEIYELYTDQGLAVRYEDVVEYVMMVNIDKLAEDNPELIQKIVGSQDPDEVVLDIFNVISALMTENNNRYCAKGLGFDSLFLASTPIFDKGEKAQVVEIEKRIREVVEASSDREQFNALLNDLLMDMIDAKEECFQLQSGAGYNLVTLMFNFVRINFLNLLDETNGELIKYIVVFADDGVVYENNARSTAYYRGFYNLLTDCKTDSKTLTK